MEVPSASPLDSSPQGPCPRCNWKLGIAAVLFWLLLIGIAFKFDAQLAHAVERVGPNGESIGILSKFKLPAKILSKPGTFPFTIVVAALLFFLNAWKWRAAAMLMLAGIIGGFFYAVIKWSVGRERPEVHEPYVFHHFAGGLRGFLYAERLSFPSGHAMLAFATAMVLSFCVPRWWALFFVLASVVGAERVLEHSHYLSDVIAGAGVGVIAALLAKWVVMSKMASKTHPI